MKISRQKKEIGSTPLHFDIANGLNLDQKLNLDRLPREIDNLDVLCRRSAMLGRDFPGTYFTVLVDEGQVVRAGEPVLADRTNRDIRVTSPVSGTVSGIHRGARRSLVGLEITCDHNGSVVSHSVPERPDPDDIRQLMLDSGLWATLRSRPFGYIPAPDKEPKALLVTAIDSQPQAPDPAVIVDLYGEEFSTGLAALEALVRCPLYLCTSRESRLPPIDQKRFRMAEFGGPHPSGLPGTHIHKLCPISFDGQSVWHIGYQDVISLGRLIITGCAWQHRVISIGGPAVKEPRLIHVPLGAAVHDLLSDSLASENTVVISGSILSGHHAVGHEAYLGQRHCQITAVPGDFGKVVPGVGPAKFVFDSAGDSGSMLPLPDLDRVAPPGILAAPLLRALLVGDIDRARELGALELVEEDLALLSLYCPSKSNYGNLLRELLDQLHREGV